MSADSVDNDDVVEAGDTLMPQSPGKPTQNFQERIDLERSVSGGENKVIGDPIDVVLVTRQGAIDP